MSADMPSFKDNKFLALLSLSFLVIGLLVTKELVGKTQLFQGQAGCTCTKDGKQYQPNAQVCNASGNVSICGQRVGQCFWQQVRTCSKGCQDGICCVRAGLPVNDDLGEKCCPGLTSLNRYCVQAPSCKSQDQQCQVNTDCCSGLTCQWTGVNSFCRQPGGNPVPTATPTRRPTPTPTPTTPICSSVTDKLAPVLRDSYAVNISYSITPQTLDIWWWPAVDVGCGGLHPTAPYQVQVSYDPSFSSTCASSYRSGTTYALGLTCNPSTTKPSIYARVRARDKFNNWSGWQTTQYTLR